MIIQTIGGWSESANPEAGEFVLMVDGVYPSGETTHLPLICKADQETAQRVLDCGKNRQVWLCGRFHDFEEDTFLVDTCRIMGSTRPYVTVENPSMWARLKYVLGIDRRQAERAR